MKQAHAALAAFVVESARTDIDDATLGGQLEDAGLSAARVKAISQGFARYKDSVRGQLARTGISFGEIVGFDWRLDYNVRSGDAGKENKAAYLLTLQVRGTDGEVSDVNISCTPEQLQDLEATVKDATQQVGRILGKT